MKVFYVIPFLILSMFGHSQSGNVVVHKDPRLDNFIKQRGMIIPPATSPQMSGYRVQLIFDSNKKIVDDARSKFISQHPKIDTYISYSAPHFTLKVGDFRSKQDAEKIKDELMRDFPTCFIVKETINLPRID
ncbi:MAG: SPOR domain-containing protein [Bacteroidetes bacterium]|nr:MAG: SPOR domain-containing protein [Bacteroidota bacterium]